MFSTLFDLPSIKINRLWKNVRKTQSGSDEQLGSKHNTVSYEKNNEQQITDVPQRAARN